MILESFSDPIRLFVVRPAQGITGPKDVSEEVCGLYLCYLLISTNRLYGRLVWP